MKKYMLLILFILISLVTAVVLGACSENTNETSQSSSEETSTEQTTTEDDPTIDIDGYEEMGDDGAGDDAVVNDSGIKRFRFSYENAMGGNNYYYDVWKEDEGAVVFECEFMEHYEYGTMSMETDQDLLDKLNELYVDKELARWDGYNKYAPYVDDGDGFYLSIEFNDGSEMTASGSNCYPDRYREFEAAMEQLLSPLAETLMDKAKEEVIQEGISGELNSFMADFIQHGRSGEDKYEFFIMRKGTREKNFDVRIQSESGEFFEKGTYNYYCELDDEAIDFAGIKELIEKYNIISWYGYDETAEDYVNSEWFQVSFDFDEGSISAMGTEHPENYEEFRHDFLELMAKMIENARTNYGLEEYK